MTFCTQCGTSLQEAVRYCSGCGAKVDPPTWSRTGQAPQRPLQAHSPQARGFGQIFGLDPRVAFLAFIVDLMLNAGELATMGLIVPFSVVAGIGLGYITFKTQTHWYGDDKESAKIKAVILGLMTAIPTALPAFLYVPSGVLGLFHSLRRKWSHT